MQPSFQRIIVRLWEWVSSAAWVMSEAEDEEVGVHVCV